MSNFGFYPDAPSKIRYEGSQIVIKFEKTSPTTARISWTLPVGVPDDSAYNGIVVVIDTVAINQQRTVADGTYYTGDPTVDTNLFAGDKIDSAYVIGAFYDDKTTTYIDITGIKDNTPYYVAGFAVDNTCHYHTEGVHSYSQKYGSNDSTDDTRGYQLVNFGVNGTDPTGLDPLTTYSFQITVDGSHLLDYNTGNNVVITPGTTYDINVLGSNAATFDDLINNINFQLATASSPFQGAMPPNTGAYYYDTTNQKLYQWDGSALVLLDPVFSATDPTVQAVGAYWFEQDTTTLYQWDGAAWVPKTGIHYIKAPNELTCDDFWFDGTTTYVWDSVIWKPLVTKIQETDPAGVPQLVCNSYWFNETDNTLSYWKDYLGTCNTTDPVAGHWVNTTAILWATDPRIAVVGEYWFNETTNTINVWNGASWDVLTNAFYVGTTEPTLPAVNFAWYNPSTEELHVWNGTTWVLTDILVWTKDPTVALVGELWWNTTTDELYIWDQLTAAWKIIPNFTVSGVDPSQPAVMAVDDIWYVPSTQKMYRWDGSQWCLVTYINWATDPTIVANGDYYYNTVEDKWYIYNGTNWVALTYTLHDSNPSVPALASYWFNTANNTLWQWNGAWVPLMYSVTVPSPPTGTLWYDNSHVPGTLYSWNGTAWVSQIAPAFVVLNDGNLAFFSGTLGSQSTIYIVDGTFVVPPFPFGLFASLTPTGKIQIPVNGTDGVSNYPTWAIEGIGTDGSSDERRDMAENILLELGYPTIQVELTKEQLDFCIDQALQVIRRSSSTGYERVYFFMDLMPGQQHYIMSDKAVGFNKIVNIMGLYRMTSAFLGTAEGQGVYGQLVLQHLYQMGTFDLVSYHIINEYVELMEKLFAANLMYKWDERKRRLSIQQNLWRKERILVDATIERTEQDILGDRLLNNWIQTWATAEARMILAEIRGKYQSLPGAGGGIALNASDLRQQANADFEKCWQELDDFIATDIEEYGLNSTIIMG